MAVSLLARRVKNNFYQQLRNGYIVLLPEVSAETCEKNELLKNTVLKDEVTPEKLVNTFGNSLLDFEHSVREIENELIELKQTGEKVDVFENILEPLETSSTSFETTWALLKTFYFTNAKSLPAETYLPLHDRARQARSLKYVSYHIYNAFKNCDLSKLTEEESRVVNKFLIEGKLNGLELTGESKLIFEETGKKISVACDALRKKTILSRSLFKHTVRDPAVLKEFPDHLRKAMGPDGSTVNLSPNVYPEFLAYCPDRQIRRNAWMAANYSPTAHPELNTTNTLEEIRSLRRDLAKFLNYNSYAHMSMETKMAGSIENVYSTIDKILEQARPLQEKELDELTQFANQRGFKGELAQYDVPFWARHHKREVLGWDEEKLREYFPFEKVMNGFCELLSEAFGLSLVPAPDVKTWHPLTTFYHVIDHGTILASLIIDPYAREGKVPGAHAVNIRPSCQAIKDNPLSVLIFNFSPPTKENPSLLKFSEVEAFFSKFGTVLQQLLSTVNYSEVSGLSFVEWDAVDVVSNIMSLSLDSKKILASVSSHYKTGEKFPFESVESIRRHMIGYNLCHELYLSRLDLELHSSSKFWLGITKDLWSKFHVLPWDKEDQTPCNFIESVCGPYTAAYFSKFWSMMLAMDAYHNAFDNPQAEIPTIGTRFRDTFLSFGGSCHPCEVFRRFQGRDPTPEAFISSLSLSSSALPPPPQPDKISSH